MFLTLVINFFYVMSAFADKKKKKKKGKKGKKGKPVKGAMPISLVTPNSIPKRLGGMACEFVQMSEREMVSNIYSKLILVVYCCFLVVQ